MNDLDYGRDQLRQAETMIADSLRLGSVSARLNALHKGYSTADTGMREALALAALTRLALPIDRPQANACSAPQ